jgi:hypothetical protein
LRPATTRCFAFPAQPPPPTANVAPQDELGMELGMDQNDRLNGASVLARRNEHPLLASNCKQGDGVDVHPLLAGRLLVLSVT